MNMMLMRPLLLSGGLLLLAACGNQPTPQADRAREAAGADATRAAEAATATPPASDPAAATSGAATPGAANAGAADAASAANPDTTNGVASSSADGTVQSIDRVLGDGAAYQRVFRELQKAVGAGDAAAVAVLMRYPLRVSVNGKARTIPDAATFQREYADIVTADIANVVKSQSFDTVMVNQQGVMLGDGQVWITGTCSDSGCTRQDVKVSTIQAATPTP